MGKPVDAAGEAARQWIATHLNVNAAGARGEASKLSFPTAKVIPHEPVKRGFDGSSISFDARAMLSYPTGMVRDQTAVSSTGTLEIDAGQTGRVALFLTIKGSFTQEVRGDWTVSADAKGALKIFGTLGLDGPSTGDTDYHVQPITTPSIDDGKGTISFNVTVVGNTHSSSTAIQGGGQVKLNDNVQGGGGVTHTNTSNTGAANLQESFMIKINVVNIPKQPAQPEPRGTVTIGKVVTVIVDDEFVVGPFVTKSATALDTSSPFNPGTAKHLKATSVDKAVYDLYATLPDGTRDSINNGKPPGEEVGAGMRIEIHGYASNTDTETRNKDLSLRRAQAVLNSFKSLGVPANAFQEAHPHGEWETRDDQGMEPTDVKKREKESADWRKVVIKMRYATTVQNE